MGPAKPLNAEIGDLSRCEAFAQRPRRARSDLRASVPPSTVPLASPARASHAHAAHAGPPAAISAPDVDGGERLAAAHVRGILNLRIAMSIEDTTRPHHPLTAD